MSKVIIDIQVMLEKERSNLVELQRGLREVEQRILKSKEYVQDLEESLEKLKNV